MKMACPNDTVIKYPLAARYCTWITAGPNTQGHLVYCASAGNTISPKGVSFQMYSLFMTDNTARDGFPTIVHCPRFRIPARTCSHTAIISQQSHSNVRYWGSIHWFHWIYIHTNTHVYMCMNRIRFVPVVSFWSRNLMEWRPLRKNVFHPVW